MFFTILLVPLFPFCQDSFSLLNPECKWNRLHYLPQSQNHFTYVERFSEQSTIINDKEYFEILQSTNEIDWEAKGTYYREENRRYYRITPFQSEDQLIYDFGLSVMDTFVYEGFSQPDTLIVTEIDSIEVLDGSMRKRIKLRCLNDPDSSWYGITEWIEGIGNIWRELSNDSWYCGTDGGGDHLLCYYCNDDMLLVNDFWGGECNIVPVQNIPVTNVKLYPNPTRGQIIIESTESLANHSIVLYNMLGEKVLEQKLSIGNMNIDISSLPRGILTYQIFDEYLSPIKAGKLVSE